MSSERWEVNYDGSLVWQEAAASSLNRGQGKINIIKQLFNRDGWSCEILDDTSKFIKIGLYKDNVEETIVYHVAIVNVVNEYRANSDNKNSNSSYEKRIQGQDFSELHYENKLVFGLYVVDNDEDLEKSIIVSWPEQILTSGSNRAYRVNTKVNIQPARLVGLYADKNSAYNVVTFKPEYIHAYLKNREILHRYENQNTEIYEEPQQYEALERLKGGNNILLYGVPGCGKSHTIKTKYCKDADGTERVVFHPDYTYGDFVGQIMPMTDEETGKIKYEFSPGPFTRILSAAYNNPAKKYCLVVEEINRGNAPAIFGDIFQLLDREEDGSGSYDITNLDVADKVYIYNKSYIAEPNKIKLPSNLYIFATMNTSDQNVFTLDTAFQRRWNMRMVENDVAKSKIAGHKILDTSIKWAVFNKTINELVLSKNVGMTSSEDKRLGAYFVTEKDLHFFTTNDGISQEDADDRNHNFPEKVLKYLWDDAFKFTRDEVFKSEYDSLEKLIKAFETAEGDKRFNIFSDEIFGLNQDE